MFACVQQMFVQAGLYIGQIKKTNSIVECVCVCVLDLSANSQNLSLQVSQSSCQ